MKSYLRAVAPVLLLLIVSGCGQKGKLMLPVRPPAISTPYPVEPPKADEDSMDAPETSKQ